MRPDDAGDAFDALDPYFPGMPRGRRERRGRRLVLSARSCLSGRLARSRSPTPSPASLHAATTLRAPVLASASVSVFRIKNNQGTPYILSLAQTFYSSSLQHTLSAVRAHTRESASHSITPSLFPSHSITLSLFPSHSSPLTRHWSLVCAYVCVSVCVCVLCASR